LGKSTHGCFLTDFSPVVARIGGQGERLYSLRIPRQQGKNSRGPIAARFPVGRGKAPGVDREHGRCSCLGRSNSLDSVSRSVRLAMAHALEVLFLVVILPLAFAYLLAVIGLVAVVLHKSRREDSPRSRDEFPVSIGTTPSQPPA
jgi:hypothetical protein